MGQSLTMMKAMTLRELEELKASLGGISAAMVKLDTLGLAPLLHLNAGTEARISFANPFGSGFAAVISDPVKPEVQPAPPVAAKVDPAPVPVAPAPEPAQDSAPPDPDAPLTPEQRLDLQRRYRQGQKASDAARETGLSLGRVLGVFSGVSRREKADGFRKVGEVAAGLVAKVAETRAEARPVAEPAAPVAPVDSVAAPLPPVPEDLSIQQRLIRRWVDSLPIPAGMDADLDLMLCEKLAFGVKLGHLALDLGIDAPVLRARYEALSRVIRDEKGQVSIDGQRDLLNVLRLRAEVAA